VNPRYPKSALMTKPLIQNFHGFGCSMNDSKTAITPATEMKMQNPRYAGRSFRLSGSFSIIS